ncbi:MAG: ABC transporter permease [Gaiellaceae bacterium]
MRRPSTLGPIATYARYELVRTARNRRFYLFAFGFPLALFYAIAAPQRGDHDLAGTGIAAPLYFMVSLAAFGTMNAVLATGGRIAGERSTGWNRHLRLTPLTTRGYFLTKVLTAYVTAAATLVLFTVAGLTLGVRLPLVSWLEMMGLILVGLVPFAGLGVLMGHLLNIDSIGPAMGGTTAFLAFFGGVWFPITSGAMHQVAMALPTYWLVQAGHIGVGGHGWSLHGWVVIAVWSVGAAWLAQRAYARDTRRY